MKKRLNFKILVEKKERPWPRHKYTKEKTKNGMFSRYFYLVVAIMKSGSSINKTRESNKQKIIKNVKYYKRPHRDTTKRSLREDCQGRLLSIAFTILAVLNSRIEQTG